MSGYRACLNYSSLTLRWLAHRLIGADTPLETWRNANTSEARRSIEQCGQIHPTTAVFQPKFAWQDPQLHCTRLQIADCGSVKSACPINDNLSIIRVLGTTESARNIKFRASRRKIVQIFLKSWLGHQDSNLGSPDQNRMPYRLAMPQPMKRFLGEGPDDGKGNPAYRTSENRPSRKFA